MTKSQPKFKPTVLAAIIGGMFVSSIRAAYAPLPLVVAKLDDVPEPHRGLYKKEGEGDAAKFRLDVDGIEDTGALKRALEGERDSVKELKRRERETAEKFKDIDPVRYRALMAKIDGDEELKLLSEGKHDEVFNKRTEKMRESYETQLKVKDTETEKERGTTKKYRDRVLDNAVRSAAITAGIHPHAVEDALLRARQVFSLNEEGEAERLGEDKKPIMGPKGNAPYSPLDWFEEMKSKAPHWFPAGSTGSGAESGKGGTGGAKTIKRSAFDALSAAERKAYLKGGGKVVD